MIRVVVCLSVGLATSDVRELWHSYVLPGVPRVGEFIEIMEGWGLATIARVTWGRDGEVDLGVDYRCTSDEIDELVNAGGWSKSLKRA